MAKSAAPGRTGAQHGTLTHVEDMSPIVRRVWGMSAEERAAELAAITASMEAMRKAGP
jgi:hypothetical protein